MPFLPEASLTLLCRGVVQGVGFRPWVHQLAVGLGLRGCAENVPAGVRLRLCGRRAALQLFLERLSRELPPPARLEPLEPAWGPPPAEPPPEGVEIRHAPARLLGEGLFAPALPADRAPCPACLAEQADPRSRRHRDPFISCSRCGPRYSIATAEPYARAHTTLAGFPLCAHCLHEFHDPTDRRFHAETISCPRCGPRLAFWSTPRRPDQEPEAQPGDPIENAAALLRGGGILALQGVGGFQLLVDATDEAAVRRLRRRKRRPAKPLALLVADPSWVEGEVQLGAAERRALADPAAPIVLLSRRPFPSAGAAAPSIAAGVAPGSPALGVMLPASPLHRLLSLAVARPLVATSGNPSGEPMCLDPREALERLGGIADAFLVHNRPIARRLDDSVLQVIEGRAALVRRARGYAPEALSLAEPPPLPPDRAALALGGDLKAAPALAAGGRVWLAPHLGDLNEPRSLARLRRGLEESQWGFREGTSGGSAPAAFTLLCDAHPDYRSSRLAEEFTAAAVSPVDLLRVPHHLAHGLAVLAEHGLGPGLREAPVLVLACDGLGAGPSPEGGLALWGCELLLLEAAPASAAVIARRLAALRPFPLPGGERAAAEPRRSALGLLSAAALQEHPGAAATRAAFSAADRALLEQAIAAGCNSPGCSSLGRLFDGMASLVDLCQCASFEGEAGLALQALATEAWPVGAGPRARGWRLPLVAAPAAADLPLGWLDWQPVLEAVLGALATADPDHGRGVLAVAFHAAVIEGLVAMASAAAASFGARRVLLAGGCFQNRLLLEGCAAALRAASLVPHWGEAVPANDGGLALGQLWAVSASLATTKAKPTPPPQRAHVPGPAWSHPLDRPPSPRRPSGGPGGVRAPG